jgi:DNA-binding IclR family transcriptional regulator
VSKRSGAGMSSRSRPATRGRAEDDRLGIQSVEVAADVLKALAAEGGAVPLRQLAAALRMPRAKVHRYLVSLRRAGLVAQDTDGGQYRIGPAAVTIGLVGLRGLSPMRHISQALPALRDRVNETVTMAIWTESGPTVVAMEESDHIVTMNVRIGSVLPLLSTAIGRLFAAYLPAPMTSRLIAAERSRAGTSAPPKSETERLLGAIRKSGLSRIEGALLPGVDAIAAPVMDHRGMMLAAICVVGRQEIMDGRENGPVVRALHECASELSRQLGYAPPQ